MCSLLCEVHCCLCEVLEPQQTLLGEVGPVCLCHVAYAGRAVEENWKLQHQQQRKQKMAQVWLWLGWWDKFDDLPLHHCHWHNRQEKMQCQRTFMHQALCKYMCILLVINMASGVFR